MKSVSLVGLNEAVVKGNVYADKSSLILDWLLKVGREKEEFTLREVPKDRGVSVGLVQRVFDILALKGLLQIEGVRTSKKFLLPKPGLLLKSWIEQYNIMQKCKMWSYRSELKGKAERIEALKKADLSQKIVFALHSAAEAYGCKNTKLKTLELHMLDPAIRPKLEEALQLKPQEKGYDVLLIKPYYKSLLNLSLTPSTDVRICPALLTFLDLYHYPLHGEAQAEFMAERIPELAQVRTRAKKL
jgi:hypothetical protein